MRNATPLGIVKAPNGEAKAGTLQPIGPPGRRPPVPADPSAPATAPAFDAPVSAQPILDPTDRPYSANGKLFGHYRGVDFECSATAVASRGWSVIFTAGHCVHERRYGWARHFQFVPAYTDGAAPYGKWAPHEVWTTRQWIYHEDSRYDYAALAMRPHGTSALQNVVGAAGFAWNQP
jgi:V8-like Glu-specific endopeptidase